MQISSCDLQLTCRSASVHVLSMQQHTVCNVRPEEGFGHMWICGEA